MALIWDFGLVKGPAKSSLDSCQVSTTLALQQFLRANLRATAIYVVAAQYSHALDETTTFHANVMATPHQASALPHNE
eukprot:5697017-Amphidinium_carterae.1